MNLSIWKYLPTFRSTSHQQEDFAAFISYSNSADEVLAPALASALRKFAVPWYPFRSLNIFLDKTDLAANPGLWPTITQSLAASRYFLLLASPEAALSPWVRKEVDWWLTHRSIGTLLIALTAGDIKWDADSADFDWIRSNAIPDNLRHQFDAEPLYVDLRACKQQRNLSLKYKKFRYAVLDLAAPIHGKPKSELGGEDRRNRRRAYFGISGTVTTLALLGAYGFWQQQEGQKKQKAKFAQELVAKADMLRLRQPNQLPQSVLLAIESLHYSQSPDALQALSQGLSLLPHGLTKVKHHSDVIAVSFSPDGVHFATGGDDGVGIWETMSGKQVQWLTHPKKVSGLVFGTEGRWLATACWDGIVRIWKMDSDLKPILWNHGINEPDTIRNITVSRDGRFLATASSDGNIRIWDVSKQREIVRLPLSENLNAVALSPDGFQIAAGTGSFGNFSASEASALNVLSLWDFQRKEKIFQIGLQGAIQSIAFSSDGLYIATGGWDGTITIFDSKTGRELHRFDQSSPIRTVSFSPDGIYLASAGMDQTARVWNWREQREVTRIIHSDVVNGVAFSLDGLRLATASSDDSAIVWESGKTREIEALAASETYIGSNGLLAAILLQSLRGEITHSAWESFNGYEVGKVPSIRTEKRGLVSPDGRFSAFIARSDVLFITGVTGVTLNHPSEVLTMVFSPDSRRVATGSRDNAARIWEVESGKELMKLSHKGAVSTIDFHPNGRYVVTGADDNVHLWDVEERRELMKIPQSNKIRSVAFSPDGQYVAVGSEDSFVKIWSLNNGLVGEPVLSNWLKPERKTKQIEFSPGGRFMLTFDSNPLSFNGDIARVWVWRAQDLIDQACDRLIGNFNLKEWRGFFPGEEPRKTCPKLDGP